MLLKLEYSKENIRKNILGDRYLHLKKDQTVVYKNS